MRADRVGEQWRLVVSDTGPGIAAEFHERIFEEFFQVPGPARAGGTGLGLPIAAALAEASGGSLELRDGPSGGLSVRVTLPAKD